MREMKIRKLLVCAALLAAVVAHGRVELLAPEDGGVLSSIPGAQRATMAKATQRERRSAASCEQGHGQGGNNQSGEDPFFHN